MTTKKRESVARLVSELPPDDPARRFIEAMEAEGFDPSLRSDQTAAGVWFAAHAFAAGRARPHGAYSIAEFASGSYVKNAREIVGHFYEGLGSAEAIAEHDRNVAEMVEEAHATALRWLSEEGPRPIRTLYVRLKVKSNGQVDLDIAAPDPDADADLAEAFDNHSDHYTTWNLPEQPMTEPQAQAMAETLEYRLRNEMKALFRPARGGPRKYRARTNRVQHGLSERGLALFAAKCQEYRGRGYDQGEARERAAADVGLPSSWGGKTRADQLRRLERKAQALSGRQSKSDTSA